jgi:hypothetical protein
MTDNEYDLLEELYFIQSFQDIQLSLGWPEYQLIAQLHNLWMKGWMRCVALLDGDEPPTNPDILHHATLYHYVASKEGLKAHNSR